MSVLPGLSDIRKVIFGNVKSLDSTEQMPSRLLSVLDIILDNLDVNVENPQEDENEDGESQEISVDGGDGDGNEDGSDDGGSSSDKPELTDRQKKQLTKCNQQTKEIYGW